MYEIVIVFPQDLFHSYRKRFQLIHHECFHKHHFFDGGVLGKEVKNTSD